MQQLDYLKDKISFVSLVDKMEVDAPLKTVNSARISYAKTKQTYDDKDKKLASFLWENEHTSPFRHSYFTFHIKAPLFLFNQLKKYQVGSGFRSYEVNQQEVSLEVFDHFYDTDKGCSWNEISGRYVQTSHDFYIPSKARANPPHGNKQASKEIQPESKTHEIMKSEMYLAVKSAIDTYDFLINLGLAKEIARMILPQNIYSECYWTVSLQAIIHFLKQRHPSTAPSAQYEIQQLAVGIYELMEPTLTKLGITKDQL